MLAVSEQVIVRALPDRWVQLTLNALLMGSIGQCCVWIGGTWKLISGSTQADSKHSNNLRPAPHMAGYNIPSSGIAEVVLVTVRPRLDPST